MQNLQIYRASAGSGKTHALTSEYLKLAFAQPIKYSKILAVTFTNKAAEEMKNRIVSELRNLAQEVEKAPHYNTIKSAYPDLKAIEIKQLAQQILNYILHDYSRFAVGTIDSFVQKVIRSFSYEIGVQSGYKIEMNQQKVINDLADMLYKKIDSDKQLLKWLIRFAIYKIEDGKDWDFRDEITQLAKEIFKEKFQSFSQGLYKVKNNKELLHKLLDEVYKAKNDFEAKMKIHGTKAVEYIDKQGIDISSLGRNFKTIANYLTNKIISPKKAEDYTPIKTIIKALEGVENWHAKSAKPNIIDTVEGIYPTLNKYLQNAVKEYNTNFKTYNTAKNVLSNFHAFGILSDISALLPDYREINNLLLISDTTNMLKEIVTNNDAHFIYEKIGNRFNHILIDEFQDTSSFQWTDFKPLVVNSMSDGFLNLIVGDIKQSIYRWRGGDWKLLLHQVENEIGKDQIENKPLETNWRSKKNIIDFNNAIFRSAPQLLQNDFNTALDEADEQALNELTEQGFDKILTDAYSDSYQKLPNKDKKGGNVKVSFFAVNNRTHIAKKWREQITEYLPQTIENLIREKNYNPSDITILVRKNKEGRQVVDLLLDYMLNNSEAEQYDIISAESLNIINSKAIRLLISAFKYLFDDRDIIQLTTLIHQYQSVNDHIIFNTNNNNNKLKELLPDKFINHIDELKRTPLYELSENLIEIFSLDTDVSQHPYIRAFQDAILDFSRNESPNLASFLNWWDENGSKLSIQLSESLNALQIMTIHKAKGLAFKIVIIPFCDWKLDHESFMTAPILWTEPKEEPFNIISHIPVKYKKDLCSTFFLHDYFNEKLQTYMDALNMFYVALTRPIEELIIMAPTDKSDKISHISDILYHSIVSGKPFADSEKSKFIDLQNFFDTTTHIYENNNDYITQQPKIKDNTHKNNHLPEKYPNNNWRKKLTIKNNSSDFFIKSVDYIEEKVNYGTLMHKIMSRIKVPDDINSALQEFIFKGIITSAQSEELKKRINKLISRPEIIDWFTDKWIVRNEKAMLTTKGKIKIPDRILIKDNKAIVIDFKFGKAEDEHKQQVKEYMDLLSDMKFEPVEGYLYYADNFLSVRIN